MNKLLLMLSIIACSPLFATPQSIDLWQDFASDVNLEPLQKSNIKPIVKRSLTLDEARFKNILLNKQSASRSYQQAKTVEIDLPLPAGDFVRVQVFESPILSTEMQQRYPDIKTWRVVALDNPAITGRIDFTSKGFHAMLSLAGEDTVFIDPDNKLSNTYQSLSKRQNRTHFQTEFNCQIHHDHSIHRNVLPQHSAKSLASLLTREIKTYRLAIAATAEYTHFFGGKDAAFASTVTTINRINQLYIKELGIQLQLVTGTEIFYTDADTDPYTNNDPEALLSENMQNMEATIGSQNFDLGHVFARSNFGGLAYVGVACIDNAKTQKGTINTIKAGGATGILKPQGETFSLEYVAHEMGHQLGASHTFNSTLQGCSNNRTAETAVEPGSGSTIMSYSGLCGSDDLQFNSDANFHFASISQIKNYTRNEEGSSCGINSTSGSNNPLANAGADINIPAKTPFMLDGTATDGSTFAWDQIDTGEASRVDIDTGDNAIIRSFPPTIKQQRFVPNLKNLFADQPSKGEKLPTTTRTLEFAYVVRDGKGGIGSDFKTVNVHNTHSTFSVVSQSSSTPLRTGQSIGIIWNIADTNSAPINCQSVDIQLLRETGETNMILAATNNDGNQQIIIPASTPVMTDARIMIGCSDRSFFNISKGNVSVRKRSTSDADNIAPDVTLKGNPNITLSVGQTYIEPGYSAYDNVDGSLSVRITGQVDSSTAGEYILSYTATDSAGNSTRKQRIVSIVKAQGSNASTSGNNLKSGSTGGGSFNFWLLAIGIILGLNRRSR